ncbi:exonuclease SbcC [Aquiflexum balticum DSM 16537]|uniref:Exonuclease SbcC n=1 Tax=Aquiflexum balticum DSM 16537 TaxID=758820 RepID=A0A1W2H3V0_9BACT|nr:SMC family ATPase [Aquiflexum balticum]SMD43600.1 exonuclease SbcC [Aquiflexum balticum DSM 16537]
MIPVKLEIQGLYSYKEKQVIAFDQLTAAGLFGIFGAVGSGKSSILEAILLALYGSTERLSDRGEKNSMVNLQSETLLITFEFRAGNNNVNTYIARYSAKRNPKNFEDVKPAEHAFYLKKGDQLEPLTQVAEDLVGMKKEHFKQTIIIPQGKFRDFIDLTPGPRAEMMKELFGLERFDLASKTGTLLRNLKDEKIRLETQLGALAEITPELQSEKTALIKEIATQAEAAEIIFGQSEQKFKKQEEVQAKHTQLQVFLKEWEILNKKRTEIENKKAIYKDFLKAKTYLKPVWEQIQEKNAELEKYRVSVTDCKRFKETYEQEIEQLVKEELELKEKADKKSERETKIRDLKKVIEIKNLNTEFEASKTITETLKPDLDSKKEALSSIKEQIKQLEEESENIIVPHSNTLSELKGLARDWDNWESQLSEKQKDVEQISASTQSITAQIETLNEKLPESTNSFEAWIHSQKQTIQTLDSEKEKLMRQAGLAAHAHLLINGEACPLCGAIDHPHPLAETNNNALESKNREIELAKSLLERIITWKQVYSEQQIRLDNQNTNKAKTETEINILSGQIKKLKQNLISHQVDTKETLDELIQNSDKAIQKREKLLQMIKELRKNLEERQIEFEKEERQIREAEQTLLGLSSKISAKKEEIKDPLFCKPFFEKDKAAIEQTIQKVQQDIEETAFKLSGKQKVLLETRTKQATNLANLKNFENQSDSAAIKISELQKEFESLKITYGFEDEEKLIALFHHSLDADKVDAEIRQFEDRNLLVKNKLEELQSQPGVSSFDPEAFVRLQHKLQEEKSTLEAIKKSFTLLDQELISIKEKLEEKQKLQVTFSQLEKREINLKELERLFKGSGFVKYVSSIYLKELCATANLRFMKLTKNSLSLEIDDNNTFWVIDYLNGGKKRLLKTLSGGQTFQASLCLALALAEKVKSLNQADQSFFFLDEGFGALDRNSLRVVFETLKSLRHENRIVGIISHVEELQQEIEVYAKVELDPERGSQVGYSF